MDKLSSTDAPGIDLNEERPDKTKLFIKRTEVAKLQEFQFDSEVETPMSHQGESSSRSIMYSTRAAANMPKVTFAKRSSKKFAKSLMFSNTKFGDTFDAEALMSSFVS